MNIYFLTSNYCKFEEVESILESDKIKVFHVDKKIKEIQSSSMTEIAKEKVIKAFISIGRPIFVEQTGLLLKDFGNLPGGLTQVFWDSLGVDLFSRYFSGDVTAKTVLAYCDGKNIETFEGEVEGQIVNTPRGSKDFQWDCVFQPNCSDKTFAEMGDEKNNISMRKIALEKFSKYLEDYHV